MDIEKRTETSHGLGLRYVESRHQEVLVAKDEEVRRQKVQVTLLLEENGRLQHQVLHLDERVNILTTQYDNARVKLDSLGHKCREQDGQLRAQAREHAALRTELLSLNDITNDSTKVLTEKLALSRELAVLKPEVEHLRSQLAHQNDVLSEKLALERQLNTLEVDLANEKRATQRALQQRQATDSKEVEGLQQQVQELEKKLTAEKRARERTQKELKELKEYKEQNMRNEDEAGQAQATAAAAAAEATAADLRRHIGELETALDDERRTGQRAKKALETELSEARGQMDVFEQRVGDLKAKLREVREELKDARTELAAAVASDSARSKHAAHAAAAATEGPKKAKAVTGAGAAKLHARQKRRADEPVTGPELMLETPGMDKGRAKRPLKKRGFDPSMAVQKSAFSITPFLNKTSSHVEDSPDGAAKAKVPTAEPPAAEADTSASNTSTSVAEQEAPEEGSELPEDSIMGRRVSASATILSSVDIADSSSVPALSKAAAAAPVDAPKRRGRPPKDKALREAPQGRKNAVVPPAESMAIEAATSKPAASESAAVRMTAEQENRPPSTAAATEATKAKLSAVAAAATADGGPKKKKRKILGASSKTVFDDEDEDEDGDRPRGAVARPVATAATATDSGTGAAVKRVVKPLGAGRTAVAGGGGGGKRTMLGGMRNAFGAAGGGFSPLKRDRRGVNASFLA